MFAVVRARALPLLAPLRAAAHRWARRPVDDWHSDGLGQLDRGVELRTKGAVG